MDFYIARAMQIATLTDDYQVNSLHDIEKKINRGLNPHDIQRIFSLPELKHFYGIPDDPAGQRRHSERIRNELISRKITKTESGELITQTDVDPLHQFDWAVFRSRDEVDFFCQSKATNKARNLSHIVEHYQP